MKMIDQFAKLLGFSSAKPTRWEYKHLWSSEFNDVAGPAVYGEERALNKLGGDGWELVAHTAGNSSDRWIFKRRVVVP